jgi:hypothetical protein
LEFPIPRFFREDEVLICDFLFLFFIGIERDELIQIATRLQELLKTILLAL